MKQVQVLRKREMVKNCENEDVGTASVRQIPKGPEMRSAVPLLKQATDNLAHFAVVKVIFYLLVLNLFILHALKSKGSLTIISCVIDV